MLLEGNETAHGVVSYRLAQRPALANCNLVTLLNTEGRGNVRREVLVALLISGVLGDVVEVLASDDEGSVHLGGDDGAGQDTASDRNKTGERALLVCRKPLVPSHARKLFVSVTSCGASGVRSKVALDQTARPVAIRLDVPM